jgi:hypothetical protein
MDARRRTINPSETFAAGTASVADLCAMREGQVSVAL